MRLMFLSQAEAGIRDRCVTGVQTCALVISSRRRHTRSLCDWSSDVCSSDLGGFDYTFGDSGWYIGNWNSSVDWLPRNSLETDFYGGYKFKAGEVDLDFGALQYLYSGNSAGNTTELYGAATYGPFTAKYSHTVSKDYFNWAGEKAGSGLSGRNTGYLWLGFTQEVMPKVTVKASLGFTRFASDIKGLGVPNYMDYSVGGAYDFGDGVSLGAAVTGANKKSYFGDVNKARL